jgi:hypothetical protein
MKPRHLTYLLIVAIGLFGIVTAFADTTPTDSPVAFAPEKSYDFKPVPEGVQVTHTFIIQNKGTALLRIENVKTG